MRALILLALPLAFACSPVATTTETTVETTTVTTATTAPVTFACTASSTREWRAGGVAYTIEGRIQGATCADADAIMRISAPDNAQLFSQTYRVSAVPLAFMPNATDQTMRQTEVEAWTQNTLAAPSTANQLPAWPAGADKPPRFTPAPGVTREQYQAARTARRPVFCYPDGGESNACAALDTTAKTILLLGSQTPERE